MQNNYNFGNLQKKMGEYEYDIELPSSNNKAAIGESMASN
jgi:hypothetical protein